MTADPSSRAPAGVNPHPVAGAGGLSKIVLAAADGARAEIYLQGAHVTSWIPAGGEEDRLFLSATSPFAPGTAIRGGVPVCFPQFADQGPLPAHGFARLTTWTVVRTHRRDDGAARAQFRLTDSAATRALWPHPFAVELTVTVGGATLTLELDVTNTGATEFAFTTALHTYLRVVDLRATRVRGLQGAHYRDKVLQQHDVLETAGELAIAGPLDRVYHAVPAALFVREPDRWLVVRASGVSDTVVWNPGPERGAALADLEPGGYARMLCVEAAVARTNITLASGETWRGTQALTVER